MSRGLVSPRGRAREVTDLGERSALIARQRVDRARKPRRPGRGQRLVRLAGIAALAAGLLLAPAAAAHWLLTSPRFAVAGVEVKGASRLSAERIRAASGIQPGVNLWRLDPHEVAARLEALPEIRRAEIVRDLPNRVTIVVEERRPFTLVHGERLHWLDEEGRVIGEVAEAVAPAVPVVSGLTEEELASMRTAPGPRARAAIALIRALLRSGSALATEISEIDMSRRDGPVLYTVDGIEVRLGTEDWDERLARLEGVLTQVTTRTDAVRAIDLRFRDQVVLSKGSQG
ncbi:MAG: FtsQ-type POTRA domain-containing protein [Candidatus Rokubacteria bacterium]|nr:FtsQ-type POTRA domain-containing protein [Candidatus Rokubacteria bacterium]MBI3825745.1 FtsQ-type POTRA domain-containing protein [Candidatus Rokubacteria bacterium]